MKYFTSGLRSRAACLAASASNDFVMLSPNEPTSSKISDCTHNSCEHENISGILLDQKQAPLLPNAMGPEFLPIVTAILAAPAIGEIIKSLTSWIQTRRPKIKVALRMSDGSSVEVDAENVKDVAAQLDAALNHLKAK